MTCLACDWLALLSTSLVSRRLCPIVSLSQDDNFGLVRAGYLNKWESDNWAYGQHGRIVDKEYSGPGLEEVARKFL